MQWVDIYTAVSLTDKNAKWFHWRACMDRKINRFDRFKKDGNSLLVNIDAFRMPYEYDFYEIAQKLNISHKQAKESFESGMAKLKKIINKDIYL